MPPINKTLPEIGVLWALRCLVKLGGHKQFIAEDGFVDEELAKILGLDAYIPKNEVEGLSFDRDKWYGLSLLDTFQILKVKLVSLIRRLSTIVSMPTLWIVKHFDVIKDVSFSFLPVFIAFTSDSFFFKVAKKAFSNRIIPAVTATAHARFYVELFQQPRKAATVVL